MSSPVAAWGIDVGHCVLKAVRLRAAGDALEVEACHAIEHGANVAGPGADRVGILRDAVGTLRSRADLGDLPVVVSVAGTDSLCRFVSLPPVDRERVGDLVDFEARQQIPFPIDEAAWRWQFLSEGQGDDGDGLDVVILAVRRDEVAEVMAPFTDHAVAVSAVQMRPVALYNLLRGDGLEGEQGATLLADVGAQGIEFVVADGRRIWAHAVDFGADRLTDALALALDVPFPRAEAIKRSATGTDAEDVCRAAEMPVNEIVLEFRRCVDNYEAIPGGSSIARVVAVGNGLSLPGLREAIEWCLEIQVDRLGAYHRIRATDAPETAGFRDAPGGFAVACGLCLQGLGLAAVDVDFLPSRREESGAVRRMADRLLGRLRNP